MVVYSHREQSNTNSKEDDMKKYLVSSTTHDITGRQIDAWEGDYIEAASQEDAAKAGAEWEAKLLKEDDAEDVEIDGTTVFYKIDGEEFYKEISVDWEA